jgi:predicted ATPase
MNIVSSIAVEGFWGTKNFTIDLHPDINFLIGVNGSGKTTLINMVAAGLTADVETLDRLPFSKLQINLLTVKGKRRPSIEIEKTSKPDVPYPQVCFRIRDQASDSGKIYELDVFEPNIRARLGFQAQSQARRSVATIVEHLAQLVKVSWLSIHRSQTLRAPESRSFESTVDRKVDQIANELVRYFSQLIKRAQAETATFEQRLFLSLIDQQDVSGVFTSIPKLNLEDETVALTNIFEQFGMTQQQFSDLVAAHFAQVKSALDALASNTGFNTNQFAALLAMARIHSLVQEWHRLLERQKTINTPREEFLRILNEMTARKTYHLNEKNELVSILEGSNAKLPLSELSSGEKQLLIILAEGLLQQKTPWIYIADEPELSLHVRWQEQLVNNVRTLNPESQIIFATHSPDVVGTYASRVFDMEDIVK